VKKGKTRVYRTHHARSGSKYSTCAATEVCRGGYGGGGVDVSTCKPSVSRARTQVTLSLHSLQELKRDVVATARTLQ
jgi:hypothetical protein